MTTSLMRERTRNPFGRTPAPAPVQNTKTPATRGEWVMRALCRDIDPDALFVQGAEQRKAAAICKDCPVLMRCRVDALENRVEFGVWGGLTERQRRALLRKNPHVTDWAAFFANEEQAAAALKPSSMKRQRVRS